MSNNDRRAGLPRPKRPSVHGKAGRTSPTVFLTFLPVFATLPLLTGCAFSMPEGSLSFGGNDNGSDDGSLEVRFGGTDGAEGPLVSSGGDGVVAERPVDSGGSEEVVAPSPISPTPLPPDAPEPPSSDGPDGDTDDGGDDPDVIGEDPIDEEPVPEPEDGIEPGTLTAGSFDDNLNFEVYTGFLSDMLQDDAAGQLPTLTLGQRVVITVRNDAGEPVGDATVIISDPNDSDQQAQPLLNLTTGSDGRVLFLTGVDAPSSGSTFTVTVYPPDGSAPVIQSAGLDSLEWDITLPAVEAPLPAQLDLAFVVDATGSMSDELEYLKVEMDSIVQAVDAEFPNVVQRYALVVYRDEGDEYVTRTFDFTGSLAQFQADLAAQFASGGGDYPEAMHLALEQAGVLDWGDRNTARVLFLVADAPPHAQFGRQTLDAVSALRSLGVAMYPVAASGVAAEAEFFMRTASLLTLSRYLFLTDDSGVGLSHAEPHIPCYLVQPLNELMIQMIASELAGLAIHSDPATALRQVGNPVDGVCMEGPPDFEPDDDFDEEQQ